MLSPGLRVVRGRDWIWDDQDGGEGFAGTIVEIGKAHTSNNPHHQSIKTPDKTAIVQWDRGSRSNYRIGYQDSYDLLVFDNAAAGVKHIGVICNGCKVNGIFGILWMCTKCSDYDLCTQCYMSDVHNVSHPFKRYQTPNSTGVAVSARSRCRKIPLMGIFVGAKVCRGPDWEWGNQDGGKGKIGKVIDIRGWDNESGRSVGTVTWSSGSTNVYRLGYRGCVDLRFKEPSTWGTYYKEHLPIAGQIESTVPVNNATSLNANIHIDIPNSSQTTFSVGDKVKVAVDVETLKIMQNGHGGWNPKMSEYIGKMGTVHRITDKGDVRVQYDSLNNRWTFHPGALIKIDHNDTFSIGDIVRIKPDINAVKFHQKNHGEWIEAMKSTLGKCGKVIKLYGDGDIRVLIEGHTWTFSPLSVNLIRAVSNSATSGTDTNKRNIEKIDSEVEKLLRDAARGRAGLSSVKEFLRKHPDRVDAHGSPGGGKKTCLQVAAHQGQKELCILLLEAGASLDTVDEDGDTPLHYAAFGNQPQIIELLLSRGSVIDAVNHAKCSALHVAVNKQYFECVKVLLKNNCNVNLQDSYGDTTLHDAIGKGDENIINALCLCQRTTFTIRNKRGFNVLHHASLKGNLFAVRKIIGRARHLVDVKKEDGFAALHLAALNGHKEVASTLLSPDGGKANVDLQNNRKQTPLQLATSQGHWNLVELFINHNANIACADEDGDTALHIAISRKRRQSTSTISIESIRESPALLKIWRDLEKQKIKTELTLIVYMVSRDHTNSVLEKAKNSKGKTPLDLLRADPELQQFSNFVQSYQSNWRNYRERPVVDADSTRDEMQYTNLISILSISERNDDMSISTPSNNRSLHAVSSESETTSRDEGLSVGCNIDNTVPRGPNEHGLLDILTDSQSSQQNPVNEMKEQEGAENIVVKKDDGKLNQDEKDLERLRYLESRIADLEEANLCSICMEQRRNVAFLCGHGACELCAAPLKICHMCRQTITKKINLY